MGAPYLVPRDPASKKTFLYSYRIRFYGIYYIYRQPTKQPELQALAPSLARSTPTCSSRPGAGALLERLPLVNIDDIVRVLARATPLPLLPPHRGGTPLNMDVKLGGISQMPLNNAPILAARPSKVKKIGASRRKVY